MDTNDVAKESAYDWVRIPVNLPRKNLVLIVAKTPKTTIHPEDPKYPIRNFDITELHDAARSLAQRPVGMNHRERPIWGAFTVDANWNDSMQRVEALIYLPDMYIEMVKDGTIKGASVEFTWRDEVRTESGTKFTGFVFNRVDLLENLIPGDTNTFYDMKLLEAKKGLMEGTLETDIKQDMIQDGVDDVELSYFKECQESAMEFGEALGEPLHPDFKKVRDRMVAQYGADKGERVYYAWVNKHNYDDTKAFPKRKKESNQIPEQPMNNMSSPPAGQEEIYGGAGVQNKPDGIIGTVGQVGGNQAVEGSSLENSLPVRGGEVKVVEPDKSKQRVESQNPENKNQTGENSQQQTQTQTQTQADPDPLKVLKEAVAAKDVEIAANKTKIADLEKQVGDMKGAVTKLQESVSKSAEDTKKAVEKAKEDGKKEVMGKINEVLPSGNTMTTFAKGEQTLARRIRKRLEEK